MKLSENWQSWKALVDIKTCLTCRENNGKLYKVGVKVSPWPPVHPHCRCIIERLFAILAGTATDIGMDGADWFLKTQGKLPEYYISKEEAESLGWKSKRGNLHKVLPGKMIFGGRYRNDDGRLPSEHGRVWYEADINYKQGRRNKQRVVFSNDGLMFVTYDHYGTFIEIE